MKTWLAFAGILALGALGFALAGCGSEDAVSLGKPGSGAVVVAAPEPGLPRETALSDPQPANAKPSTPSASIPANASRVFTSAFLRREWTSFPP